MYLSSDLICRALAKEIRSFPQKNTELFSKLDNKYDVERPIRHSV